MTNLSPEQIKELRERIEKFRKADKWLEEHPGQSGRAEVGERDYQQKLLSYAALDYGDKALSMAERCVVLEEQAASAREDLLRILPGSLNPHLMIGEAIRKLTPTNNTKDND